MLFWKKKKDAPTKSLSITNDGKAPRSNELLVRMRGGSTYSWEVIDWDGKSTVRPWREFYRWFFGRSGEFFTVRYRTGETTLRRSEILSFTIQTK